LSRIVYNKETINEIVFEVSKTSKYIRRYFIMAYVITDGCVSCGTCAGECPVNAISEGDGKYVIDADSCIECGTCAAACPTGAIEG